MRSLFWYEDMIDYRIRIYCQLFVSYWLWCHEYGSIYLFSAGRIAWELEYWYLFSCPSISCFLLLWDSRFDSSANVIYKMPGRSKQISVPLCDWMSLDISYSPYLYDFCNLFSLLRFFAIPALILINRILSQYLIRLPY